MNHTKGPWTACCTTIDHAITHWHITGKEHGSIYPICNHTIEERPSGSEQLANAYLIAAAPTMLEALELAMRIKDLWAPPADHVVEPCHEGEIQALSLMQSAIVAAIAKAKGE